MIIISLRKKANIFFIKKHISGINNKIEYKDAILKNTTFEIIGNNNSIVVMKDCRLENVTFYIRGNDNSIILHDHVQYNGTLWTVCNNGCIDIGMHTTTEHNVNMQIAEDDMKIEVGNDCMFSSNISIWTQDWHKIYDENEERINNAKNVKIKNHVWIGYDSKILKGVIIGNNNIIGANTVVTKSYEEENVVIAGNPGKIVKRGINWKR
jgi:acetyltransferase-like isoleucine patch superfamily enzyme